MKYLKTFIVLLAITIALFGCEKEEPKPNQEEIADISVKNGVLVFKDWQVVYSTLASFENSDAEELDKWEKNLGFTSLRTVYDCFLIEEQEMVKQLEKLYNENKDLVTEELVSEKYSELLNSYENSIVPIEDLENDMKYYDINLYHTIYSPILNEYGIVSVEGEIYRFTNTDERKLIGRDWSKLSELMNDDSPFLKITEEYNNNLDPLPNFIPIPIDGDIDGEDPVDPVDPNSGCSAYSVSSATSNQWEAHERQDISTVRTIVDFKFLQKRYSSRDYDCNYNTYTITNFYYRVQTYRLRMEFFNVYIRELSTVNTDFEYLLFQGNDYQIINSSWFHKLASIHSKTLYSATTTSNHPYVANGKLTVKAYINESVFGGTERVVTVYQ